MAEWDELFRPENLSLKQEAEMFVVFFFVRDIDFVLKFCPAENRTNFRPEIQAYFLDRNSPVMPCCPLDVQTPRVKSYL